MRMITHDAAESGEREYAILVVDDMKSLRQSIKFALASEATNVKTAANGFEADQILVQSSFDLVLLDIRMPKMSGLELLRRLRQRGDMVRIIIESADLSPESLITAVSLGVVGFLKKPFSLSQLRECVDIHLKDFDEIPGKAAYQAAADMSLGEAAELLQAGDHPRRNVFAQRWQLLFQAMARGAPRKVQLDHARRLLQAEARLTAPKL